MKGKCVVIIPVHTASPSTYELISFRQCFKILHKHPVYVLAPEGLALDAYRHVVPDFLVKYINPKWQSSLLNYNKLKLSRYLYRIFKDYECLLTYELDAFVFKDELNLWCSKDFDYIGAPWFSGYHESLSNAALDGVGNSGFSLRKIKAMDDMLKDIFYDRRTIGFTGNKNAIKTLLGYPYLKMVSFITGENYSIQRYNEYNEDFFIGKIISHKKSGLNIAPVAEAIKFSFEMHPSVLFEWNGGKLPFGCHAWWRYNFEFWKPHIRAFGYDV
ncbi:MAG: DUF5672 family protein [Ferruginibacter sp.]